ncbi:DDE Tnp4 domain-containing protein [Trichonephila clavata]|uniref:DDE Tnp4 domain-containing protein n=1 Tax=Trichonephila clavata TaxID=2740835 RepID=A0A8X6FH41_TRICU|nr:DDE Tnp4 domain-containing protein [Trichonephila clavata]
MLPFLFIGDEAFPLKSNLMRPYPGVALSKDKAIFNYRLSRARRCVENAFGIMASRFRIFRKPLVSSLETSTFTVAAAVCLHNFIKSAEEEVPSCERRYCPLDFTDNMSPDGYINDGRWRTEEALGLIDLAALVLTCTAVKLKRREELCKIISVMRSDSMARCSHSQKWQKRTIL